MKEFFAVLSALLIVAAAPPYIVDTLRHKTKPERITWLIFSVLGIIAFISQLSLGASWSLLFSGLDTSASIMVFCLSIKFGVGGYTKLDVAALSIASLGAIIAIVVKQPIISLLGVIIADLSGMALTVRKVLSNPESETAISWLLVGTASLCGILIVGRFSFGLLLYPVYLLAANYAVPVVQLVGYRHQRKNYTIPRQAET